jgi:hypothetical protein
MGGGQQMLPLDQLSEWSYHLLVVPLQRVHWVGNCQSATPLRFKILTSDILLNIVTKRLLTKI